MPYRMLVTDLDFTCLNEEHEVPEANVKAARRAVEAGLIFTVATGRGKAAAEKPVLELAPNAPVILQNGMSVYDFASGRTLFEHLISTELTVRAVRWGETKGFIPVASIEDRHYVSKRQGRKIEELEALEGVPTIEVGDLGSFLDKSRDSLKVANLLYICEPWERDGIASLAAAEFPEVRVIVSGPPFVEFLSREASKGHALTELCAMIGVDMSEVVVVGDAPNDAEMMQMAGRSYAVANAEDGVKRIAWKVTKGGNNDGVLPEILLDAFGIAI